MGENTRIIQSFFERFSSGDIDGAAALLHPDVISSDPGAGRVAGRDGWRAYGEAFKTGLPDGALVFERAVEQGDMVIVEGRFTGTQTGPLAGPQGVVPPSGRRVDLPFADVFRLRDGLVVEHRIYYDQIAMLGQLGLLPQPDPVPAMA